MMMIMPDALEYSTLQIALIAGEGSELGTHVLAEIGQADDLDPGQLCFAPLVRRL